VKHLATIATRKAILPENVVSLPAEEEQKGHQPKVPMADASFVMKRAIKRSTVPIEEAEAAEEDLDPAPEVSREKDHHHDQEVRIRTRKSKLTLLNLILYQ
jgi:hypothetical protein